MSYVIKASLSNAQHPEHERITIPFPIPVDQYDQTIETLRTADLGFSVNRDCTVDEVESRYRVLDALKGTLVNVDQLDYLAKRLEGFCSGEASQFQAMDRKLELTDIKDFINLTYCCQQATVITDFSDLGAIGRSHFINLNGGGARVEELDLEHLSGDDLPALNRMCQAIASLKEADQKKLNAVICMAEPGDMMAVRQLAENLDQFDFVPGIQTPEEYGKYMIQQSGRFEYDENLEGFYDYRRYGEQCVRQEGGQFNAYGYVAYHGTMTLEELMTEDPAEQKSS